MGQKPGKRTGFALEREVQWVGRESEKERGNEAALCQEKAVCYCNWPSGHPVVSRKFYEITQYCVWAASLEKLCKKSHCGWRIIWGKTVIPEGHNTKWSGSLLTDRALSVEDSQEPYPELQEHTPDSLFNISTWVRKKAPQMSRVLHLNLFLPRGSLSQEIFPPFSGLLRLWDLFHFSGFIFKSGSKYWWLCFENLPPGNLLVVKGLGLCASTAGSVGLIPGQSGN